MEYEKAMQIARGEDSELYQRLIDNDPKIKGEVEAALAKKNPELDAQIRNEQQLNGWTGGAPVRPDDLKASRPLAQYRAELDTKFAVWESENRAQTDPSRQPDTNQEQTEPVAVPPPVDLDGDRLLTAQWGGAHSGNIQVAKERLLVEALRSSAILNAFKKTVRRPSDDALTRSWRGLGIRIPRAG